jgi:hypothetical protein
LPAYVIWTLPWARFLVPSFAAFTPVDALAFFTPFGRRSSGQILKHCAAQGVLLAFNV